MTESLHRSSSSADWIRMKHKSALCAERGRLIDEQFLGRLTPAGAERLAKIEQELDRLDAPRVALLKKQRDAEFSAIDLQISQAKAQIEKNASDRPQAKTAGSH